MGALRFELRSTGLFLEAIASTDQSYNHCHRFLRLIAPKLEPVILARLYYAPKAKRNLIKVYLNIMFIKERFRKK